MNQPAADRAARAARLARLVEAEPGLNQRQLADRLGVSQATVQRDLRRLIQNHRDSPPDSPTDSPETHVTHPADTPDTAAGESPRRVTWADRMQRESDAHRALAAVVESLPADSPHRHTLTVPTGPQLVRDLSTLMDGTGADPQTILAAAVYAVAAAYRDAHDDGALTPGPVKISSVRFLPVTADQLAEERAHRGPSRRLLADTAAAPEPGRRARQTAPDTQSKGNDHE